MSYNKVTLIGFVGKDAEVKTFESGNKVANFTLATSERGYKLANGTEVPERTDWHNIVCVNNNAAFAEKWIKKGSGVLVEGKLRNRVYEKNGLNRYITEIFAERVEFFQFGKKQESNQPQQQQIQYEQEEHIGPTDGLPF